MSAKRITYIQAITDGLRDEMRRDESVFCIGEDIGTYGGAFRVTKGFLEEFGRPRILDTPLSESAIVGSAIGAALMGLRPVVEMQFADFVANGFNMIVNFAAKAHYRWGAKVPMVIRMPTGGGTRGGPFHATNCEAWFTRVPGLKVVAPATPADAKGLLKAAIRDENPVLYFEHKFLYRHVKGEVPDDPDFVVPLGEARLARRGSAVSLIAYGSMAHKGLAAAEELAAEGLDVEVLDLRSLIPLDEAAVLDTVRRTNRVVICHEDTKTGGFGGEIAARIAELAFEHLDAPVRRVAAIDTPVPYAPQLEDAFLPQPEDIKRALRETAAY